MNFKIILLLMFVGALTGYLYIDLHLYNNIFIKNPSGLFTFLGLTIGLLLGLLYNLITNFFN